MSFLEIIFKYLKIGMISFNQNLEFHRIGGASFQCNFLVSVTKEKNSIINVEKLINGSQMRGKVDFIQPCPMCFSQLLYIFFLEFGHNACHAFCNITIMTKCPCPEQSRATIPMTTSFKMISMSFLHKLHSKDIMVSTLNQILNLK